MLFFKKTERKPEQQKGILTHPVLGEVAFVRNPRAKRIIVSVKPPGKVRLTIPPRVSEEEGMRFLTRKKEWVLGAVERQRAKSEVPPIGPDFTTRSHSLRLVPTQTDKIRISVRDGYITVAYPEQIDYKDDQIQSAIKKGIEEAWRIEARVLLPGRIEEIARSLGFRYKNISVRNTVSKWGSCSARNDISLSVHLMRLPDHLINYIIIHELCHTVHHNHGPQFHALLDKHTAGRHRALHKQLKAYNTRW